MLPALVISLTEDCPSPPIQGISLENELFGEVGAFEHQVRSFFNS